MASPRAATVLAQDASTPVPDIPPQLVVPAAHRSTVNLVRGENRRNLICEPLAAIDKDMAPAPKGKTPVLLKVNPAGATNQRASTHTGAILNARKSAYRVALN